MSVSKSVPDVSSSVDDLLRQLGVDSSSRGEVAGYVKNAQMEGKLLSPDDVPAPEDGQGEQNQDYEDADELGPAPSVPPTSRSEDDTRPGGFPAFRGSPDDVVDPDQHKRLWRDRQDHINIETEHEDVHRGDALTAGVSGGWDQPGVRDGFDRVERDIDAASGRGILPSEGRGSGDDVRSILVGLGYLDS